MNWQIATGVIAAILGSTGIAGSLTGGFQLTRRARLRRSIERSAEVASKVHDESKGRPALLHSIDADVLRLAALTLVGFPSELRRFFRFGLAVAGIYVGFVVLIVSYTPVRPAEPTTAEGGREALGWLIALVGFVISLVMALNMSLKSRREKFSRLVLQGTTPEDALDQLGEESAIVQVLGLFASLPFRIGEVLARLLITVMDGLARGVNDVTKGLALGVVGAMSGLTRVAMSAGRALVNRIRWPGRR